MRRKLDEGKNRAKELPTDAEEIPRNVLNKHMRMVLDHLWGPTGSVLLHIFLVALLFRLVWDTTPPSQEVEVTLLEMQTHEIEEMEEQILDDIQDLMEVENLLPQEMVSDERPPDPAEFDRMDPEMDVTVLSVLPDFQSPLILRDLYAIRTDDGRAAMLARHSHGWGRFTEPAVIKALEWLRRNQLPNGSWASQAYGDRGVTAVTGLGLMAFLAHGETTGSERYGETVRKAIEYLQGEQQRRGPTGAFCALDQQGVYAHGIATYAISEAYAMTAIPSLRESMDAAVRHIVRGQQPRGGFDYHFNKGARRDTSVSGWMVQAMKAALMAGSEVEGLSEAIDKATEDLKRVALSDGQFSYNDGGAYPATTAIGALSLQLSGHGRDPTVVAAINFMRGQATCSWDGNNPERAMYIWFYQTQAKFHHGGGVWTNWNNQFAPAYVNSQQDDGHWRSPGNEHQVHGPAYTTALGALTLQVYYRFLPTFQIDAVREIPRAVAEDEGDGGILIDFM